MKIKKIGRRNFFQLATLAGFSMLTGCTNREVTPNLTSIKGTLPKELVGRLPSPWSFNHIKYKSARYPYSFDLLKESDLLAINDGWLGDLSPSNFQPIEAKQFFSRINSQARIFLNGLGPKFSSLILPIGVSPWVMLFRNGDTWLKKAYESWEVLLDQGLEKNVVLPESPRLIISLAEQMKKPEALSRLRFQACTFDSRNALNWVLSGQAKVAVIPLQNCFRALSRDPRLSVALPSSGSPLHWTVLLRPLFTREPLPQEWLENAWSNPLLGQLLGKGWTPPLEYSELIKAIDYVPYKYQSILLQSEETLSRCWSFQLLSELEQKTLEKIWNESSPKSFSRLVG